MKKEFTTFSLVMVIVLSFAMLVSAQTQTLYTFEAEQPFSGEESFRYVVQSKDWASQGERSARAVHRTITEPQKGFLKIIEETDWTAYNHLVIDFYNPHDVPVDLAAFIMTGSSWDWNESALVRVEAGETLDVVFDLKDSTWKNSGTNWEHAAAPPLDDIVGWGVIVYPTEQGIPDGSVYFDNFRIGTMTIINEPTAETAETIEAVPTAVAQAVSSPISFRAGDWKIGLGDGKLSFEDNLMHVTEYQGWKLIEYGANTDAGVTDLTGYTGIQFDVKVEEAATIEFAIQLADWNFTVVHRQDIEPDEGWVTLDVDLSDYDLSHINALCIQGSGADFSARNIVPTPTAAPPAAATDVSSAVITAPAAASAASKVKISGKTELDMTVRKVEVLGDSPIALNPDDWKLEEGAEGTLTFEGNSMHVTDYPGWKRIERKLGDDLSAYTGIEFELKVEAHTNFQFIVQPKSWAWTTLYAEDHSPDDGWVTVTIDFAQHGLTADDLSEANALIFQAGAVDWAVRNMTTLPKSDSGSYTEVDRDYNVDLNLAYSINDDWTASVSTTLAEESLKVGLVEVKGTAESMKIRAFFNGTGANMGDPMTVIKGEKYYKDKTAGIDLRMPIYIGSGHLFLSTPMKPFNSGEKSQSALVGGSVKMPILDSVEVQLLGAAEFLTDADQDQPYVLGGVVNTVLPNEVKLTGETLFSGKEGIGFYGKAAWKGLEAGITHAPAGLWTERGDFNADDGYGTYYIQGNTNILENLNAGFYFNQWYNHKKDAEKYKNYFAKIYGDWTISKNASLNAVYEQKKALNTETKKYDKPEGSKLLVQLKGSILPDLTGQLFTIMTNEGTKNLKIPAYVGRLTYTGLDKWTLIGEYGLSKKASTAPLEHNLHMRAKYAFTPNGSIEIGVGKPTLNTDDDAVVNRSTAKHYYTLKFKYSF